MLFIRKADALQTYKRLSATRNISACHLMQLFKDSLTNKRAVVTVHLSEWYTLCTTSMDRKLEATVRFLLTVLHWVLDKLSLALKMTKNSFWCT